ncbi:MAG: GerAB/ArcD/ProY family transporter [Clostridiaceae bacterium]
MKESNLYINKYQLFCLIVMHSLGSATLFALGIEAKQDAWIVVLISLFIGFGIVWIHTGLQRYYPEKNIAEILKTLLGKRIGGIIALLFATYFFWISNLNFSEFCFAVNLILLQFTPRLVVQIIVMSVIVYITYLGLEVLARTSEIFMPVVFISLIGIYILLLFSSAVHFQELKPVFSNGLGPILKEAYPTYATFPYGEDVVFLVYYCYVNKKEDIRKVAFLAISILGSFLVISTILIISVLGAELAASETIPLLAAIKQIDIGRFLTNFDSVGMMIIFIGGVYKAMLFFYGAVLTLSKLFKIKTKFMIFTLAVLLIWFNYISIPNLAIHRVMGIKFTNSYLHPIYGVYIPMLLLIIAGLKRIVRLKGK